VFPEHSLLFTCFVSCMRADFSGDTESIEVKIFRLPVFSMQRIRILRGLTGGYSSGNAHARDGATILTDLDVIG
jgi:hypothetical protein